MEKKNFRRFYRYSVLTVLAAAVYPVYMGVRVVLEMLQNGAVPAERYPKYVIPYTPIALALIAGVLLIPVFYKLSEKRGFLWGSLFSMGLFFAAERLMETKILVVSEDLVMLESWQMAMCYVPPEQYRTRPWQAVDVLLGGYSPAFKLHFYLISAVLILALLNGFYGFAKMVRTGNTARKKALTVQSAAALLFLGMCIWACFTSFYRTGELTVSAASAVLMAVFFALLGITVGVFAGSFLLGRAGRLAVLLPAAAAILTTAAMYGGEMILLSGHLYRFGTGFFFSGLGGLVLAPADLLIILASGGVTACLSSAINGGALFRKKVP